MNRKLISILTFIILTAFTIADKLTLDEIPDKSYHPIIHGQKLIYKTDFSTFSMTFDTTTITLNGKTYIKCTTDYGYAQTVAYYREEGGRVLYLIQNQTNETVQIPSYPKVGTVWYDNDSTWKYTVTGVAESLETPQVIFLNCLVIQSENVDKKANPDHYRLYLQYYQKGRGYVGTKVGGVLSSYLNVEK